MQASMASKKNTKTYIQIIETQVGQLDKQSVDIPNNIFNVKTLKNPNENCSVFKDDHNNVVEAVEDEAKEGLNEEESQEQNCETIQKTLPQDYSYYTSL